MYINESAAAAYRSGATNTEIRVDGDVFSDVVTNWRGNKRISVRLKMVPAPAGCVSAYKMFGLEIRREARYERANRRTGISRGEETYVNRFSRRDLMQ